MLLLAAACAGNHPDLDASPNRVWASPRSLADARACVIRALDDFGRSGSVQAPSVTHAAETVESGRIYEVRPEAGVSGNSGNYYARLEKIDDHITRISLFTEPTWRSKLIRAVKPCGSR